MEVSQSIKRSSGVVKEFYEWKLVVSIYNTKVATFKFNCIIKNISYKTNLARFNWSCLMHLAKVIDEVRVEII